MAHLAAEVDDLSSTQEMAVQELTQCKRESKVKDLRITELEDTLQLAAKEHRKMEAEILLIKER